MISHDSKTCLCELFSINIIIINIFVSVSVNMCNRDKGNAVFLVVLDKISLSNLICDSRSSRGLAESFVQIIKLLFVNI
jgi:hypothetical protein